MDVFSLLGNVTRSKGDPKVIETGPGSLDSVDWLVRGLGWFSIAIGVSQLLAPRRITDSLGMDGSETLIRAYGVREITSGVITLSPDKATGLWSRVAGDALDIATLVSAVDRYNPKRENAKLAIFAILGITALDVMIAMAVSARSKRDGKISHPDFSKRSGFPKGIESSRGKASSIARQYAAPRINGLNPQSTSSSKSSTA